MSTQTKIPWCDVTWNVTAGCTKVSPGCQNCYAEKATRRQIGFGNYPGYLIEDGRWTGDVNLFSKRLEQPLDWRKPRTIFVNSMSDLFHPKVPTNFIRRVYDVMAACPQHTFIVLTKRPERLVDVVPARSLPNVIHLASVENYKRACGRIEHLVKLKEAGCGDWKIGISAEPLLGPVHLWLPFRRALLDWVIVGCESGPGHRPMDLNWVRSIRDQCAEVGVPFFFKQAYIDGKKVEMPELDGRVWDERPVMAKGE